MKTELTIRIRSLLMAAIVILFAIVSGLALAQEGKGRYLQHNYTYTNKAGVVAANYRPFLPRDDTIVIGAMFELIMKIYGKHQITDLKPSIVKRNGRNLIRFHGIGYDYYFLILKQDNGEVHGLSMWREGV